MLFTKVTEDNQIKNYDYLLLGGFAFNFTNALVAYFIMLLCKLLWLLIVLISVKNTKTSKSLKNVAS